MSADDGSRDDVSKKIASPLEKRIPDGPTIAAVPEIDVKIQTVQGRSEDALAHAEAIGADIRDSYGEAIFATISADDIRAVAASDAIVRIGLEYESKPLNVSEGVEISNADLLHDIDLTGEDITIAVIDHEFNVDNDKFSDQIVGKIGDSSFFDDDDDPGDRLGHHGTASAEVVADMAPDADLVLASTRDEGIGHILNELEDDANNPWDHVDVATMSLGFVPDTRMDGLDSLSNRIDTFTDGDRLFTSSAGNEANGDTWDGQFRDTTGNDLMEFDDDGTERFEVTTRFTWDPTGDSASVFVHWDAPWDPANQGYHVRLWPDENTTDPGDLIDESQTNLPVEEVSFTNNDNPPVYVEIEHIGNPNDITGDEHFDLYTWGDIQFTDFTPERSIGRPATSQDPDTLAVAAVQATDVGRMPSAEDLKRYSSRGPTQDGRRGIDIAAPSNVVQLERTRYNGTSAAAPHVGGAAGLLFDPDIGASNDEIREALFDAGRGIEDTNVGPPGPNNTEIGFGYLQVREARDRLESLMVQLDEKWVHDMSSRAQFATPAVGSDVYAGSLGEAIVALTQADGAVVWDRLRDGALSDSSPYLSNGTVYVGSGGGVLYAITEGTGSVEWTYSIDSALTASPVVANGAVYVGANDGIVHAVDAGSGTEQWTADVGEAVYSDVAAGNGRVVVTTRDGRVVGLDAGSGAEVWTVDTGTELGSSSPTLVDGTVYVAADDLYAIDAGTGSTEWTQSFGGTAGTDPAVNTEANVVYAGGADGILYAFDEGSGSTEWTVEVGNGAPIASSPALAEERVIVASFDGEIELIDTFIQPGDLIAATNVSSQTRSSPAVADNDVYIGNEGGQIVAFKGD